VGRTARGYATLVPLYGIEDAASLRALAGQDARWHYVDKAADMSSLFQRYRERAGLLIAAAYCFVYVFLAWRYGPLLGLAVMLPTALAAALTIAGISWLGYALNLFHLLALLLVLGIGVDYSLFLLEDDELSPASMLAILLSAAANELSFGLLTVSATPAVRAFGLTVLIGVAGSALLAPLIVDMKEALKRPAAKDTANKSANA
jgi:predicted exporter